MAIILIIDDHSDVGYTMKMALRAMGHLGVHAISGEAALEMLKTQRPDLVLLDVMMPGMDGPATLVRIRGTPETATIPVVRYSGVSDPAIQKKTLDLGADAYWVKGDLDLDGLEAGINEMIRKVA